MDTVRMSEDARGEGMGHGLEACFMDLSPSTRKRQCPCSTSRRSHSSHQARREVSEKTKCENNSGPCSQCQLISGYAFVASGFASRAFLPWRRH